MFLLGFKDLREKKGIPYSRMHIDRLEKGGQFPKRVPIGGNSVAWLEDEIDDWIKGRAALRVPAPSGLEAR